MSKDKISVIVPVYNVEKYLEVCLDSLINQTYKNLEIILVEDCSTDSSFSICKNYAKKYKNVILLQNKSNRGLSFTRNRGLEKASGQYIGFIDSDDYIPTNYYESLYDTINNNGADISICDINIIYNNKKERSKCGNLNNDRIAFIDCGLAASSCNKLFKKELFDNLKFSENKINEDLSIILPLVINANKVCYNDKVFYNYIQREKSIQNASLSLKRLDIFYAVDETIKRIDKKNNKRDFIDAIIFNQLVAFVLNVPVKEPAFIKRYKFLKACRKRSNSYNLKNNSRYKQLLNNSNLKNRLYYKLLLNLYQYRLTSLLNILLSIYNLYQKRNRTVIKKNTELKDLIECAKKQQKMQPERHKLTVTIPNYNYDVYLIDRVYSVLNQNYKIEEVILLDDCSTDLSRNVIDKIVTALEKYIDIKKAYNEKNTGKPSYQWKKGIDLAKNDYVWIAEADDYSNEYFLKDVMKAFDDKDVILSYCDSTFIDNNGRVILDTIVPSIDIQKTKHWNNDYINDGKNEFNNYSFLNCTIANVSSAVIRKGNYEKAFSEAVKYKQAGDWVFYTELMQKGKIAYSIKRDNYYRVHTNNITTTIKKRDHFNEIKAIHKYFDKEYQLSDKQKKEIQKRYNFLIEVWELGDEYNEH